MTLHHITISFCHFLSSLCLLTAMISFPSAMGFAQVSQGYNYVNPEDQKNLSYDTQSKIGSIFNNLESLGSAYNGSGNHAAQRMALDAGCHAGLNYLFNTNLFQRGASDNISPLLNNSWLNQKARALGDSGQAAFCQALRGEKVEGVNVFDNMRSTARNEMLPMLMMTGVNAAHDSNIPFLTRLEIEAGLSEGHFINSISTIQPLWTDETNHHHIFTQLSYYMAPKDVNDQGFRTKHNTLNAGLAYRYLTDDQKWLYGANVFFDHAPKRNHNRVSVGADARTSQLAFSANKYFPVSDWRKLDFYYEEKAAGGLDAEIRGQIPQLPSWTASFKGYEWDQQNKGNDLYGAIGAVEYSPVPALTMRVGLRDESQSSPSVESALRFTWRFDQPADLQWRQRTELSPVSDYVYEKVQRENIIRVKQQRRAESKLTVIQTIGNNTALESTGLRSLATGQALLIPVTVTVENTIGAIGRLRFADGSILTLAQNSQARIEPNIITLISGSMQYVNNGAVQTVVVPGGTITLHGTDIDVVSSGGNSSVRVRDGSVDFVGTVSGATTLSPEQAAESIAGVIGNLAPGSADYIAHTDAISTKIDRVAAPQEGAKVTPYPYEAPRIISSNMIVGGTIVFGLRFNESVTVSGGVPRLAFTINGHSRFADYVSGSGTKDLQFSYTNVLADISALSLTVNSFIKNGASIMGAGKDAVTTIADAVLTVSGTGDNTPPSGYAVSFTTTPINDANFTAAAFTMTSAEIGATYNYTITSSGGGPLVNGSGTVTSSTQSVTGINLAGLADGTLTLSLTLTDPSSNIGTAVTDTTLKNTSAPAGYSVSFTTTPVNNANKAAVSFDILLAEIGATYSYTITDGSTTIGPVTGTVTSATQTISPVDVTSLADGTLTVSVTLTDTGGNSGIAVTNTALKDVVAPTIISVTPPADSVYEP